MTSAAVVLAAGSSTRFGPSSKLRADFRGRPLVAWAVDAARASGLAEVIVVWGAVEVADLLPDDVTLVRNADHARGQATSLAAGVSAAAASGHDAVVVGLADQPLVEAEAWRRVGAARAPVAVATYDGARRNPVRLAAEVWPDLPTSGDHGARVLFDRHGSAVQEIPCPGDPTDIDTKEDLARWS